MRIPITVIASHRPNPSLLRHARHPGTVVIADRHTTEQIDGVELLAGGRVTISEPDTYFRSPGCPCCALREDLVTSVVRVTRRAEPPRHIVVVTDPTTQDILTVASTLLSSFEIAHRCALDAVLVHLDAVELSTRLATGATTDDATTAMAVAVADRVILDNHHRVTPTALEAISATLRGRAGFARVMHGQTADEFPGRLEAWHGAPAATPVSTGTTDDPSTVVLRVDTPLDPDAIDEWLDRLVTGHASRLVRIQGALSVVGQEERVCCFGVRSFAASHSEREHAVGRSTESVLAVCGVGLDSDDLATSFESTVAS